MRRRRGKPGTKIGFAARVEELAKVRGDVRCQGGGCKRALAVVKTCLKRVRVKAKVLAAIDAMLGRRLINTVVVL